MVAATRAPGGLLANVGMLAKNRDGRPCRQPMCDVLNTRRLFEWQAREFQRRTGIRCNVEIVQPFADPDTERATALFRIYQELLTNVARHARVKNAAVRVCCDQGRLQIQVEDHGQGFDPANALADTRSRGLAGMRERTNLLGGELTVDSALGAGTRLTAELLLGKA